MKTAGARPNNHRLDRRSRSRGTEQAPKG
jgi:hypothetical protein